jgi:hypothetical protein
MDRNELIDTLNLVLSCRDLITATCGTDEDEAEIASMLDRVQHVISKCKESGNA